LTTTDAVARVRDGARLAKEMTFGALSCAQTLGQSAFVNDGRTVACGRTRVLERHLIEAAPALDRLAILARLLVQQLDPLALFLRGLLFALGTQALVAFADCTQCQRKFPPRKPRGGATHASAPSTSPSPA
jgi:hypothetical protein